MSQFTYMEQGFFCFVSFSPFAHERNEVGWHFSSRPTSLLTCWLYLALLVIGVICSVRHDNMVGEVDVHELASPLYAFCQFFVLPTG